MKEIEKQKVEDLMTHGVITVSQEDTVIKVIRIMAEAQVHGVVVTSKTGEFVGVISELDIMKALGKDFNTIKAEEIMTANVIFVDSHMSVKDAAKIMTEKHIHRLVVVEKKKKPCGVFTPIDIINEMKKTVK